jgi:hypothetical protein
MTTTEWLTVPGWPDYTVSPDPDRLQVWSLPRERQGRNGSVRLLAARCLKPTSDGRVNLSRPGKVELVNVRYLHKITYRAREGAQQALCRRGHPLMPPVTPAMFGSLASRVRPSVTYWGTDNRVCLYCWRDALRFDKGTYSTIYGVSEPDYPLSPAHPKPGAHIAVGDEGIHVLGDLGYKAYQAYWAAMER